MFNTTRESSSGFGGSSAASLHVGHDKDRSADKNMANIESKYHEIMLHLKRTKIIEKDRLLSYLAEANKFKPKDIKSQWWKHKVLGLLHYILKRRRDFTNSIITGSISIFQQSDSLNQDIDITLSECNSNSIQNGTADIPLDLISNNNFNLLEPLNGPINSQRDNCSYTRDQNVANNPYDYSQDLFSSDTENLHTYSKQNYEILKTMTQNNNWDTASQTSTNYFNFNDGAFKDQLDQNKVQNVYKMHSILEENLNLTISQLPETQTVNSTMLDYPPQTDLVKKCSEINFNRDSLENQNRTIAMVDYLSQTDPMSMQDSRVDHNIGRNLSETEGITLNCLFKSDIVRELPKIDENIFDRGTETLADPKEAFGVEFVESSQWLFDVFERLSILEENEGLISGEGPGAVCPLNNKEWTAVHDEENLQILQEVSSIYKKMDRSKMFQILDPDDF